MKCYTWKSGKLEEGIVIEEDNRGKALLLGEKGRGRWQERVGLDRFKPANVESGRAFEASVNKVSLPARNGKKEKTFHVLARPHSGFVADSVLVRINTNTGSVRGARGRWDLLEGNAVVVTQGHGAFGDAGRVGSWHDGLIEMGPEDVIQVRPTISEQPHILWMDGDNLRTATKKEYETIKATQKAEIGEKKLLTEGVCRCFSFARGSISGGIETKNAVSGIAVTLGESGRGRNLTEVPLIGVESSGTKINQAAVAQIGDGLVGLVKDEFESWEYIVKVSTKAVYTSGASGSISVYKGSPKIVAEGHGGHGGTCQERWPETLVVMQYGDVLKVSLEGGYKTKVYALFVDEDQELCVMEWLYWKLQDAQEDPDYYIETEKMTPVSEVPSEWFGKFVTLKSVRDERHLTYGDRAYMEEGDSGILVEAGPGKRVILETELNGEFSKCQTSADWVEIKS